MSGGAGEWELEYPIINGSSSRGPMFEPREMGGELMLQLFSKSGNAHYEPYWCELNGHAFNMYLNKTDKQPCVRFDLKEFRMYPAARGLPGKEVNTMSPMFGLVSRYHRVVLENGLQEVPSTSVFFFECSSDKLRDDWLKCYYINQEWALRFSGLFYPRGSARVEYGEGVWRLKVASDNSVRYLKSSRLHVSSKTDGTLYKKGSKFGSAWKPRYAVLKGQCTLEYYSEKGGELLGKVNMADGRVVLVCNDTLTPPAGANAKEKLSNLRGKIGRRTSLAPLPQAGALTKEERQENLLWFAVMNPGRVWLFKAGNLEDLERWMQAIEDRCNDFKQMMTQVRQAVSQAEEAFSADPCLIRYKLHPLPDTLFPQLERAAIPGRPMSGVFNNEEAVKLSRNTSSIGTLRRNTKPPALEDDDPDFDTMDQELDDFSRESALSSSSSRSGVPAVPSKPSGGRQSPPPGLRKELPSPGSRSPRSGASPRGPRAGGTTSPRGPSRSQRLPSSRYDDGDDLDDELADALDVDDLEDDVTPAVTTPRGGARTPRAGKALATQQQQRSAGSDADDEPLPSNTRAGGSRTPRGGKALPQRAGSSSRMGGGGDERNAELLREKEEQLEEKIEQLEKIRVQFNTMKEEYRANKLLVKKQEREMADLERDLADARDAAATGGGADEETLAELDDARKLLAVEQKKSTRLEAQVKRLQAENDKLQGGGADEGEVEELKNQLADLENRNISLDGEIDTLKRTAKENAKAAQEMERERKKREALEARVASLQQDMERLEEESEAASEAKHALEDELASLKSASADPAQLKALRKERDAALKKLALAELRVSTAEAEAARAREQAAAAARRKDYSGISDEELREVVRALNEENDTLVAQLGSLKTALAAQSKPSNAEVVALQRDLQLALKTLDMATDRLNKMEMENLGLKRGGRKAGGGGGGGDDGPSAALLESLQADKAHLEQTVETLRKEIETHVADKAEFEAALIAMQEEQHEEQAPPEPKRTSKPVPTPPAKSKSSSKISKALPDAKAKAKAQPKPKAAPAPVESEELSGFESDDPFAADDAVAALDDVDDW